MDGATQTSPHHMLSHQREAVLFDKTLKKFLAIGDMLSVGHIACWRHKPGYHTLRLSAVLPAIVGLIT